MEETGNISKSQYSGTLKNSICNICNNSVSNLNREEQDKHAEKCLKDKQQQKTLFD